MVNGLGEAAHTAIGITGTKGGRHNVYIDGKPNHKISDEELIEHIVNLIEEKVEGDVCSK